VRTAPNSTMIRWLALASALLAVGCTITTGDDGFRAKLAAGCHSAQECSALRAEAMARYRACEASGTREPYACDQKARDKFAADALETGRLENDSARDHVEKDRVYQQVLDATHASQAEYDRLRALQGSCDDIASLEAAKPTVFPRWDDGMAQVRESEDAKRVAELHGLAKFLRAKHMKALQDQFRATMGAEISLADPDAARRAGQRVVVNAGALVEQLRCYDADAAAREQASLDGMPSRLEIAIAREEACKADPKCMGERQAAPVAASLCEAIATRRDAAEGQRNALAGIVRERANPSGFVDKGLLHDLGADAQGSADRIREADVKIGGLRGQYAKITHRPFADGSCPKVTP
jgi:hypothetical protein